LNILFCREPSERNEEIDVSAFNTFLEEIKTDYQNAGQSLCIALDKFKEHYNVANSKSIPRLTSFLYDLNLSLDPMRVKSGAQIRVQVESVKRRKTEGVVQGEDYLVLQMKKKRIWILMLFLPEKRRKWIKRSIILSRMY